MSLYRTLVRSVSSHPWWYGIGALGAVGVAWFSLRSDEYDDFEEFSVGPADCMGGVRPMPPRLIVLHSTESSDSGGAKNVAQYFANPGTPGSTQLVIGPEGEVYRSVPDDRYPCGAPGANGDGLHIEMVGYAKWSRDEWLARPVQLRAVRNAVRKWSAMYGIPRRVLTDDELRSGEAGVTTHAQITRVYSGGQGHWDPGTGFPIEEVL